MDHGGVGGSTNHSRVIAGCRSKLRAVDSMGNRENRFDYNCKIDKGLREDLSANIGRYSADINVLRR
jgi:hypothetical protein